jgi:GWxTD domain-containing protein
LGAARSNLDRPAVRSARPSRLGVAAVLCILSGGALVAQGPQAGGVTDARRLVDEAIVLANHGDTAAALERLDQATKLAPTMADAHYRRGMLLAHLAGTGLGDMGKRRAADAALERALRYEQGNPAYYLELGRLRLKQGAMRLDAERLFGHALTAARERGDPVVLADVEAELGDIYYRRYAAVGHRRLLTGDAWRFDPGEAMANPHYAKDFLSQRTSEIDDAGELDLRQAEGHYREGAAADPAHDLCNAGVLGIMYDGGRFEEFLEQAHRFAQAAPKSARAQLFLGLGLWRVGRGAEAARAFERGLALLPPGERDHVTDLSVILRRSDAEQYQALTAAQRAEYNRIYWSANDPLKLTAENEHLLEHLARVAYTDLRYSAPDLRLRGWDTDRGVIYVRYGPPPVVATFAPETSQLGTEIGTAGKITTVWFYPERNLRFVFYGPPGYNFARFAGEFRTYVEDARYAQPVKYDNVPVNEAMDSIPVQVAAFKGRGDSGKTDLVLFAGLPLTRMASGVDLVQGPIQNGLFVTDPLERPVVTQRRNETVRFRDTAQLEQRTFTAMIAPGEYRYRVEARQPTTRRAARGMGPLTVEAFDRPTLMLSDVILADRVAPRVESPAGRQEFLVDPNPAMQFAPGTEVHLYWEMYNLQPDSAGEVHYQAEIVFRVQSLERHGLAAKIVGGVLDAVGTTAKGDDQVSVRYDVSTALGERDRLPGWVAVNLADAPRGTYTLELVITDRQTGQSAVRRRVFTVTDGAP